MVRLFVYSVLVLIYVQSMVVTEYIGMGLPGGIEIETRVCFANRGHKRQDLRVSCDFLRIIS